MKSDNFISKHKILLVSVGILAVLLAAMIVSMALRQGGGDPTVPSDSGPLSGIEDTGQATGPGESDPNSGTGPAGPTDPDSTDPNSTGPGSSADPTVPTTPALPSGEQLTCDMFAVFSGEYVEDGSGKAVENVAAILVTNRSNRFLDLGTLTYDVDGEKATFVVTGLPAGRTAWVMESTGMTIDADAKYTELDCITSFRDDVVSSTEEVTFQYNGEMLRAVNNTDRTLENVVVYYKNLHTDGNYFGGITYVVNFGTLEPGASAEKIAGHYQEGNSEIVRVGWQESQTDEAP